MFTVLTTPVLVVFSSVVAGLAVSSAVLLWSYHKMKPAGKVPSWSRLGPRTIPRKNKVVDCAETVSNGIVDSCKETRRLTESISESMREHEEGRVKWSCSYLGSDFANVASRCSPLSYKLHHEDTASRKRSPAMLANGLRDWLNGGLKPSWMDSLMRASTHLIAGSDGLIITVHSPMPRDGVKVEAAIEEMLQRLVPDPSQARQTPDSRLKGSPVKQAEPQSFHYARKANES